MKLIDHEELPHCGREREYPSTGWQERCRVITNKASKYLWVGDIFEIIKKLLYNIYIVIKKEFFKAIIFIAIIRRRIWSEGLISSLNGKSTSGICWFDSSLINLEEFAEKDNCFNLLKKINNTSHSIGLKMELQEWIPFPISKEKWKVACHYESVRVWQLPLGVKCFTFGVQNISCNLGV